MKGAGAENGGEWGQEGRGPTPEVPAKGEWKEQVGWGPVPETPAVSGGKTEKVKGNWSSWESWEDGNLVTEPKSAVSIAELLAWRNIEV